MPVGGAGFFCEGRKIWGNYRFFCELFAGRINIFTEADQRMNNEELAGGR